MKSMKKKARARRKAERTARAKESPKEEKERERETRKGKSELIRARTAKRKSGLDTVPRRSFDALFTRDKTIPLFRAPSRSRSSAFSAARGHARVRLFLRAASRKSVFSHEKQRVEKKRRDYFSRKEDDETGRGRNGFLSSPSKLSS